MWTVWNWNGWIKWQVDQAVALGCNSVRLIGAVNAVHDGAITLGQYLAQWAQFLDYTASLGLKVYPCGGDLAHWGIVGATNAQAQAIYGPLGALLETYSHVIGIDVTNEAYTQGASVGLSEASITTTLTALTGTLRSVTTLPIAHSMAIFDAPLWGQALTQTIAGISDFFDMHTWYNAPNHIGTADARYLIYKTYGARPFLIGEVGVPLSDAAAYRTARYEAVEAFLTTELKASGAFAWAISDQGVAAANQYGLVDLNGVERADIVTPFKRWITSRA